MADVAVGPVQEGMETDQIYLPRRTLTLAPAPLSPVLLTYPEGVSAPEPYYVAVLSLFIGSTGTVDRVRLDTPLPIELEGVARRAFMGVRFSPGEVNGRPVRSLIRIEVQFDRGDTTPK